MDAQTQKLVDKFLQECPAIDIFGYTLGVFIAHKNHNESNFNQEFNRFNQVNGIRFEYVNLPNNQVAISER